MVSGPVIGRTVTSVLRDRKSTRLNSSHLGTSYAVFCLKKKKRTREGTKAACTDHLAATRGSANVDPVRPGIGDEVPGSQPSEVPAEHHTCERVVRSRVA